MKYYAGKKGTLAHMPGGLRLILALYLLTTLLGFWLAGAKYVFRDMVTAASTKTYYLGERGAESLLAEMDVKTWSQLADATHPHLFTVPLVLLVLSHLVQLTGARQSFKNSLYIASFLGMALTFAVPWLLRIAEDLAVLIPLGGGMLLLAGSIMCVLPIFDLLGGSPPRRETT